MSKIPGQELKRIRESLGISLEEIAQKTRIRLHYLEAIESNDEEALPSTVQLRGFLRLYASVLGVNLDELQVEGYHYNKQVEPEPSADVNETLDATLEATEEIPEDKSPPEKETQNEEVPAEPVILQEDMVETPDLANSGHSTAIFNAIGAKLKARRKLLSLSHKDIAENLHIRQSFIEALESGKFERLPSPVQARGMLVNYAEFLNLDAETILHEYAEGLQVKRIEKQQKDTRKEAKSAIEISPIRLKLKNFFSLDLLVMTGLFLSFAFFVIWGVNRILDADNPDGEATDIPEVAEVLLATGSPTPAFTTTPDGTPETGENAESTQEEPTPIFSPFPDNNPINIVIIPRQRTWVQITEDGEITFEGRLLAGNAYAYSGDESVEILTGNAGALQIYFNEQDIGAPGLTGQVASLIFTTSGLVRPTATITPTATKTPRATPSPTVTPTATQTRIPTSTPTENNDETN